MCLRGANSATRQSRARDGPAHSRRTFLEIGRRRSLVGENARLRAALETSASARAADGERAQDELWRRIGVSEGIRILSQIQGGSRYKSASQRYKSYDPTRRLTADLDKKRAEEKRVSPEPFFLSRVCVCVCVCVSLSLSLSRVSLSQRARTV